jgi:HKD family nuclease
MTQEIILSGGDYTHLQETLNQSLVREMPRVVAIATAFASVQGVLQLTKILDRCDTKECRLIAGIDNTITHPEALYLAKENGWKLRLGKKPLKGIFHPKLIVAGKTFKRDGRVQGLCNTYVGSSNLTNGGLNTNVECGLIMTGTDCLSSAADVFATLWTAAAPATDTALRNYAALFAERARRRTIAELLDLGINDNRTEPDGTINLKQQPPSRPALGVKFAVAAWAGLQSFTGDYRFQVEFPKHAGEVIRQIIHGQAQASGRIEVYCPADEQTWSMQYRFYEANSMFRLNIPNDFPGVAWVREHKDGIAIVEKGLPGGAPLQIRILRPGAEASEIGARSAALGTWGKTPTRSYGWY